MDRIYRGVATRRLPAAVLREGDSMGRRSFQQRREDRRDRLVERVQFLTNKMCRADVSDNAKAHATRERSALLWALEEIDRLTAIEDALDDATLTDSARVHVIDAICESRYRPTDADRERTPQLALQEIESEVIK